MGRQLECSDGAGLGRASWRFWTRAVCLFALVLPLSGCTSLGTFADSLLSALARKFADVSGSRSQAASDVACGASTLASSLLRSARVNFHWKGAAICS